MLQPGHIGKIKFKKHLLGNKVVQLYPFAEGIIMYIENPK